MDLFRRATIALANSPADAELLDYADRITSAATAPMELCFVHVVPAGQTYKPSAEGPGDPFEALRPAVARHIRTPVQASFHLLEGPRLDKLLEFVARSGSDFILAGHRRARTGRRSLGRRLAMKAPCSVWIVPEGVPRTISRVLVAVDFSPSSSHALSSATLLASRLGIPHCTAVYVHAAHADSPDDAVRKMIAEDGIKAFERFLHPLELNGVDVRPRIEENFPVADALLRAAAADRADLIVMGTRGLSHSSAVLLGSHSEHMLIETDRPLLVTRQRGERIELLEILLERDLRPTETP